VVSCDPVRHDDRRRRRGASGRDGGRKDSAAIPTALRGLLALGSVAAALVAAGTADARNNPPVDADGYKACALTLSNGTTLSVAHDTLITAADGKKYRCLDGRWYQQVERLVVGDGATRFAIRSSL
jgi:hypothetical protein